MKKIVFILMILLFEGCAQHAQQTPESKGKSAKAGLTAHHSKVSGSKTKAVFHVIDPLGVELIVYHIDKKTEQRIQLDLSLSEAELPVGHWQINGFILENKRYDLVNQAQKYIFRVKNKKASYVGSFIFKCPKVDQTYLEDMKKMVFFNRYPFVYQERLCEMLVGNDHKNVNRSWLEHEKNSKQPLSLGF